MIIKEKDNRLFLQHGPIDIVIEAIGKDGQKLMKK